MMLGQLHIHVQKEEFELLLHAICRTQNVRATSMELLEGDSHKSL